MEFFYPALLVLLRFCSTCVAHLVLGDYVAAFIVTHLDFYLFGHSPGYGDFIDWDSSFELIEYFFKVLAPYVFFEGTFRGLSWRAIILLRSPIRGFDIRAKEAIGI